MRKEPRQIAMIIIFLPALMAGAFAQAADSPLVTTTGTGYVSYGGGSVTLGNLFKVGDNSITITSLGLFDDGTPGLNQSHSVGLWTTSGTLLARADFLPGLDGFTQNEFIYKNLAS
jgi:hypothetical protein